MVGCISQPFRISMDPMGISLEYIQKQTPEDNGDIESFYSSIKADYIWPNELETFNDVSGTTKSDILQATLDYSQLSEQPRPKLDGCT